MIYEVKILLKSTVFRGIFLFFCCNCFKLLQCSQRDFYKKENCRHEGAHVVHKTNSRTKTSNVQPIYGNTPTQRTEVENL